MYLQIGNPLSANIPYLNSCTLTDFYLLRFQEIQDKGQRENRQRRAEGGGKELGKGCHSRDRATERQGSRCLNTS